MSDCKIASLKSISKFLPETILIDGNTNKRKVTITETGLPGRPKNIVSLIFPNARGLPGLTATFQKLISPSVLTTSFI